MKYIQGKDRNQIPLFVGCLEEAIESDNEVRLIDAYVDALPLAEFGFKLDQIDNGRPAYHPNDLLKLFLYGYLNRIRSSRLLEKECKRNPSGCGPIGSLPNHTSHQNPCAYRKADCRANSAGGCPG